MKAVGLWPFEVGAERPLSTRHPRENQTDLLHLHRAEAVADWRTKHADSSPCILTNGTSFRFPTLEERGDDIASLWEKLTDMG